MKLRKVIRHAPLWLIATGLSASLSYMLWTWPIATLIALAITFLMIWPVGYGLIRSWEWARK